MHYTLLERRLRIYTGVILAVYISQHLLNHGLGLISLSAMEAMRVAVTPFWRSPVGALLIYGSLITHFLLALWSLFRRTSLKMPAWELSQIILGLSIIPLAAGHIAGTWGGRNLLDIDIDYEYVIKAIAGNDWWVVRQLLLVLVAWLHVSIGLHFWLRLKIWYRPALPVTYIMAVLIPLFALVGASRISFDLEKMDNTQTYSSAGRYQAGSGERYSYGTASSSNTGSRYGGGDGDSSTSASRSYGGYTRSSTTPWRSRPPACSWSP